MSQRIQAIAQAVIATVLLLWTIVAIRFYIAATETMDAATEALNTWVESLNQAGGLFGG